MPLSEFGKKKAVLVPLNMHLFACCLVHYLKLYRFFVKATEFKGTEIEIIKFNFFFPLNYSYRNTNIS